MNRNRLRFCLVGTHILLGALVAGLGVGRAFAHEEITVGKYVTPSGRVIAGDQALHASSGISEFPDLVETSMPAPLGMVACHVSAPHVATVCASCDSDSNVPRLARSDDSRYSLPGFAVA